MQTIGHDRIAYSITEVSHLTGLGKTKLYELIADGELGSRKIGRRRLVPASELGKFFGSENEAGSTSHSED